MMILMTNLKAMTRNLRIPHIASTDLWQSNGIGRCCKTVPKRWHNGLLALNDRSLSFGLMFECHTDYTRSFLRLFSDSDIKL
jgi:hypothetical protein